jgi:hypothetical protein
VRAARVSFGKLEAIPHLQLQHRLIGRRHAGVSALSRR